MKKRSRFLFILCLLAALVCIVSTTAFATEETAEKIMIQDLPVFLEELIPGQELPAPTVPEDANYHVKSYKWSKTEDSHVYDVTTCEANKRYELLFYLEGNEGYQIAYENVTCTLNGEVLENIWPTANGDFHAKKQISLKTLLSQAHISVTQPNVGDSYDMLQFVSAEPDKYTCEITYLSCESVKYADSTVFIDRQYYTCSVNVTPTDAYEFKSGKIIWVNGELADGKMYQNGGYFWYRFNYNQTVSGVEFPAFPETAAPGPGGISEVIVPENADYTMQQVWMDMRTGETVETMVSGEVYTLSYIAVPKTGFHFTDETTYTLGGEPCEAFGDEQYRVLYKSYDLGAQKIDRVDVTLPKLNKGCTPENATIPTGVNYELWEVIWAESTTDSFEDALPVQVADFGTNVYAVPVLCAAPGYTFAEDVKLYFNGVEVTVAFVYAEGPMLEIAGLYGTLTPPTTDGWHQEDNTWAYYVNSQKRTSAWIADSVGWCYVGSDGLMVKNGWAKDSVGWCYLGADGYMVKNRWAQDSIGWCYLNSSGYMVYDKWIRDSVDWCYVGSDGYMCTDRWIADSVGWCYVGSDGYMLRNAWAADSVGVCRLNQDGYIVYDQWINDGYGWAYVDSDGYAVYEGWQKDSRGWCYIYSYYMITDTWFQLDGKVYYVDKNGYRFTNGRKQYNAYYYYVFDSNGVGTRYTVIA